MAYRIIVENASISVAMKLRSYAVHAGKPNKKLGLTHKGWCMMTTM